MQNKLKKTQHTHQHDKSHKRGRYSAALKEKVSLEALKGEKTLQQIASENNISPELVRQWKKQAQEVYLKSSSVAKADETPIEKALNELYIKDSCLGLRKLPDMV